MRTLLFSLLMWISSGLQVQPAAAEPVVPGTGVKVDRVGDDFEDPRWAFIMNGQKASYEQDEEQRPPGGRSRNGRWFESAMRGQPDLIKRVPTPPGGLEDSRGALMLRTCLSGIPDRISNRQMQDDLLMNVKARIGQPVPVRWTPSFTVRVYLPPFENWENRTGASFGVRGDCRGINREGELEPYWPGFFILFRSETSKGIERDFAQLSFRAQSSGLDLAGPKIFAPGWWTFGMTFTPDGRIHYYASEGVDDLTEDDHLFSSFAYSWECRYFDNMFVNVANWEDGENWSTPWVIDDPEFFVIPPPGQSLANLFRQHSTNHRGQRVASRPDRSKWNNFKPSHR